MRNPNERDSSGRPPGAPAWNGDLTTLSPAGLAEHEEGVSSAVVNFMVKYQGSAKPQPPWRVTTAQERRAAHLEDWVARLVECRTEHDRRQNAVGGLGEYFALRNTPAWTARWAVPSRKRLS